MKERSILFSAPMVRAILNGQKTQTRRVVKRIPLGMEFYGMGDGIAEFYIKNGCLHTQINCPFGRVGDRLWVRETFAKRLDGTYTYAADYRKGFKPDYTATWRWTPSLFMPRGASRITLEVTDIRVESLWDISHEDAIAEGIELPSLSVFYYDYQENAFTAEDPIESYITLWDCINGPDAFEQNPLVWVINFKKI
jgi:hypothetical protein